jgi:hypothetical protein
LGESGLIGKGAAHNVSEGHTYEGGDGRGRDKEAPGGLLHIQALADRATQLLGGVMQALALGGGAEFELIGM